MQVVTSTPYCQISDEFTWRTSLAVGRAIRALAYCLDSHHTPEAA